MEEIEEIEKEYGDVINKFDTFYPGWDMDGKGYVCKNKNGVKKIILTDHGHPYVAKKKDILKMINNLQSLEEELKEVIRVASEI